MATELQYKAFKSLYDEELARYSLLENRAKLYQTVIMFYLGAIAFKYPDVMKFFEELNLPSWPPLLLGGLLLISFIFTIVATKIRDYEGVRDPVQLIEECEEGSFTDEYVMDQFIGGLARATNDNAEKNNRVGTYLQISSYFLAAGIACQLLIFAMAAYNISSK